MNVITSRPIYSNLISPEEKALRDAEKLKKKNEKDLTQAEKLKIKNQKEAEKLYLKNQKEAEREKRKSEKISRKAENKLERKTNRTNRKANRNAKRLLRLKNKEGKEQILFPLTRLRRNKDNKPVKIYPDGTERIVKPEMVVQVETIEATPTGNVKKIVELDKSEVAEALKVPVETVTPVLIQEKTVEIDPKQAPVQADETKITGLENVIAIELKPEDVVTDPNGNEFVATQTTTLEEPIVDLVDKSLSEEKPGMSIGLKIGIGVGIVAVLGLVGYLIYRSTKKGKSKK